jgi:hypothetical protein
MPFHTSSIMTCPLFRKTTYTELVALVERVSRARRLRSSRLRRVVDESNRTFDWTTRKAHRARRFWWLAADCVRPTQTGRAFRTSLQRCRAFFQTAAQSLIASVVGLPVESLFSLRLFR